MKMLLVLIVIFLAIGCRQCAADVANSLDPLGLLRPNVDSRSLYLPRQVELSSTAYLPSPSDPASLDVALKTAFPLDHPVYIQADVPVRTPLEYYSRKFVRFIKTTFIVIFRIARRLLSLPIHIIKFLLIPVRVIFSIAKFFINLFFLPVIIGWKIFKLFLYPFKFIFQKLFGISEPATPFVVGLPNPQLTPFPTIYAS